MSAPTTDQSPAAWAVNVPATDGLRHKVRHDQDYVLAHATGHSVFTAVCGATITKAPLDRRTVPCPLCSWEASNLSLADPMRLDDGHRARAAHESMAAGTR